MPALALKPGVRVQGMRPEMLVALMVAKAVYDEHGVDCVVTSVTDGRHSYQSLHYSGQALDLRTHVFRDAEHARRARNRIAERLGQDYDVLLESVGTANEHIHIEYQPKRGKPHGNT